MKRRIRNSILCVCILLSSLLLQFCDPTYSIRIENLSGSNVVVTALTTNNFQAYEYEVTELGQDSVRFEIPAGEYIDLGMAIAGLENDLPFTKVKVLMSMDTLTAMNPTEVLGLFEKDPGGELKMPYRIVVK